MGLEQGLIKYWKEHSSKLVSNEAQKYFLKHFKDFFFGRYGTGFLLSDVDDSKLHEYVIWRKTTPIKNTNPVRYVSDGTIRKEIAVFGKFITTARKKWKVAVGEIDISMHNADLAETRSLENHIPPEKQVMVIKSLPVYLQDPVLLQRLSGLRWGNIKNLDKSQIDWAAGMITSSVKTPNKRIKEKLHYTAITEHVKTILLRNGCTEGKHETGLVFTYKDRKGNTIPLGTHSKAIKTAYKAAGVTITRGQVTHLWRHTVGTAIMDNSKDMRQVKAGLGHANIATSAKYAHLSEDISKIMAVSLTGMGKEFFKLLQPAPIGADLAQSGNDALEDVMKIGGRKGKKT